MTKVIAGLGIAGMLFASAPIAMAHERGDDTSTSSVQAKLEAKAERSDKGLHLGNFIELKPGKLERAEHDADRKLSSTTKAEVRARMAERRSHVVGGTVTSVGGSTFTIDPRGKGSTTTVTINGDTKVVTRDGATTTAAITAGTKVIAFGTTTATSTSGNSFTASVVIVINKAFGHLKYWLNL